MKNNEFLLRLNNLEPNSQRLWGSMSVNQMLTHCADQIRICIGDSKIRPRGSKLTQFVLRWIGLNVPMRMPKNMKTIAELDPNKQYMTKPVEFQNDHKLLIDLYQKLLNSPENQHFEHPVFGVLSKNEAIKLTNIHLDHHLRQFGV
jgi:hypothetical protein